MPLSVDDVITRRVRLLLRDTDAGGVQFFDTELVGWMNEGVGEVTRIRPEAASTTATVLLNAGAKQQIPVGASLLLEAVCNMPGDVEGRVVRLVERALLDRENVNWMTASKTSTVFRYCASLTDPRSFFVYPPSLGDVSSKLRIVYSAPPAQLLCGTLAEATASLQSAFPIPDMYAAPVANYVLYRAWGKVIESAEAQRTSRSYLELFNSQMGVTSAVMEQDNAKMRAAQTQEGWSQ